MKALFFFAFITAMVAIQAQNDSIVRVVVDEKTGRNKIVWTNQSDSLQQNKKLHRTIWNSEFSLDSLRWEDYSEEDMLFYSPSCYYIILCDHVIEKEVHPINTLCDQVIEKEVHPINTSTVSNEKVEQDEPQQSCVPSTIDIRMLGLSKNAEKQSGKCAEAEAKFVTSDGEIFLFVFTAANVIFLFFLWHMIKRIKKNKKDNKNN